MPFIYLNKKEDDSLQVQKLFRNQRAFFYTSFDGNLTLEAALILPIFLLAIVSIMYFLVIMHIQINIQIKLEEIARNMSKTAYVTEDLSVFNYVYVKAKLADSEFQEYINKSYIVDGVDGLNLWESSFFGSEGIIDLVVTYEMVIPFISEKIVTFPCAERVRFHTWIGKEISSETTNNSQTVYITETGTVYHTNRECSHLRLSISQTISSAVVGLRNENGGRYEKCSLCVEGSTAAYDTVYITEDGDKWHSSLSCSGLKRNVIEIDISEVGNKRLCSRCGGQE